MVLSLVAGSAVGAVRAATATSPGFDQRTRTYVKLLHGCGGSARLFLTDLQQGALDAATIKSGTVKIAGLCNTVFSALKRLDVHGFADAGGEGRLAAYAYREGLKGLFTYSNTEDKAVGRDAEKLLAEARLLEQRSVAGVNAQRRAAGLPAIH